MLSDKSFGNFNFVRNMFEQLRRAMDYSPGFTRPFVDC